MFDIGFQELLLVTVVALVVMGPERLPQLARMAGKWIGRARRTLISVQQEIERELKAEELKRVLDEQARRRPLETILDEPAHRVVSLDPGRTDTSPPAHQPAALDLSKGKDSGTPATPPRQTPRP